jgi:Ca-activated chloride channel family protein
MRHVTFLIVVSITGLLICGCLQAESRVRVYSDVDKPVVLGKPGEHVFLKVGLEGLPVPVMPKRPPLNVAIVLDRSGSMNTDDKIGNARLGAIEIVERLTPDDIFSLVLYESSAWVVIPPHHVHDKAALIETISSIRAGGRTALYSGVRLGAAQVRANMSWEYTNRIILLSDGLANIGPSRPQDLARLGSLLGDEGITVTTIGVGLDYNEDLMTSLSAMSGGNAYFAAESTQLPKIFAEEIGEAMTLAARDIRIRVDCPKGVRPVGVVGRDGEVSDRTMSVKVGALYGTKDKFALFEVEIPPEETGKRLEVARVNVEYVDPHTNEMVIDEQSIAITYDDNEEAVREQQNLEVVKEVAINVSSEAKRHAVDLADRGDFEGAASIMKRSALELEKAAGQCDNDVELLEEAAECEDISDDILVNTGLTRYQRKKVVNDIYAETTQQGYKPDENKDEDKDDKKESR